MKVSRPLFTATCLLFIAALSTIVSLVKHGRAIIPSELVAEAHISRQNSLIAERRPEATTVQMSAEASCPNPNSPPIANDDFYTVHNPVETRPTLNDSDPDGDALGAPSVVTPPQHGLLHGEPNGIFLYTQNFGYVGVDSFVYSVCDSHGACSSATVNIQVVNQAPVAAADSYQVHTFVLTTPTANDFDPDGDPFGSPVVTSAQQHGLLHGEPNAVFRYTPNFGYVGSDSFTYRICDSLGACSSAIVNIEVVNQAPVAVADSYQVHTFVLTTPTANDFDPDGDPLGSPVVTSAQQHGLLHGEPNAVFRYTPDFGYVGSDSFTYRICDPLGACSSAIVNIEVVNQAPVAVADFCQVHTFLLITPTANDSDPDGDSLGSPVVTSAQQHGLLHGEPNAVFRYTPDFRYVGSDSFTYRICDPLGACSSAIVNIEVVNQAPLTVSDIYSVRGLLFFSPTANDTDSDGDNLMPPTVLTPQQHGELVALPNSSYRYTPNQGFSGTDTFTYRVCDSLGACSSTTVTLYVIGSGENDGTCTCHARIGSPVNVTNGNMYLQQGDYALPGVGPGISVTRTYNSNSQTISLFGRGWSSDYDESIIAYDNNLARFNQDDGRAIYLGRPIGSAGTLAPIEGDFHGSLAQNGGSSTLTMIDGSVHQFSANGKLISLTDRVGNQTTLTYDGAGKLASVIDPFGRVLSFTTNSNGQVLSLSDTMGTAATYTYDASNRLLSVTYADNSAFHFTYDGNNRLTTVTDALGNIVESHIYDGQGRALTSERQGGVEHYALNYVTGTETDVTDALGHVSKYTFDQSAGRNVVTRVEGLCSCGGSQVQTWTYDGQLNVTAKTDALNHVTNYTYDTAGNRLTETDATGTVTQTFNSFAQVLTGTNQMNGVATNTYDAQGNLLTSKDALNNTSTFTYNSHGQPLTVTDARGKITTFIYDSNGRMTQHKDALNHETNFTYDDRARPTGVTNALNQTTAYEYDAAGRLKKTTFPDTHFVSLTYDLAGRRTKITDARGNETNYAYDGSNRLTAVTDALSHSMSYAYNSMSNLTSTTDALSRVTNYNYDDFNRLIKTTYPAATTGATRLFDSLSYDAAGNVTSKTDTAGRVTSYAYDNINRLTSTTDAAAETTSFQYDALSRVTAVTDALAQEYEFAYDALGRQTEMTRAQVTMIYEYDAVGNRIARTDYNGVQTNYTYDDLNRLTTIAYPDSSGATYAYDALSRLSAATNENGTVSFTYDNRGRISATTDVWGQTISYGYDANGNRAAMTLNGDVYANYAYDANNRLTELTDSNELAVDYNYDATNKLSARALPNGVNTSYTYDGLGRLTHLLDTNSSATILDNQLSYNTASQITQIGDTGGTHQYGYDAVDRLTSASYPGADNENFQYDSVGNRTGSQNEYDPFNRLVASSRGSYSYDNNGNQTGGPFPVGQGNYVYDFENRLTLATQTWHAPFHHSYTNSVHYSYDALGRRIKRSSSQSRTIGFSTAALTKFVYDGQDVVRDLNEDDSVAAEYLNGPGIDNKLRQTNGQTNYYFTSEHLGSTRALTNDDGEVVEEIAYDSFGNSTGSSITRYTYTGREFDSDTHLYYYRARFYDPHIGRFISEDPIGFRSGDVDLYAYVKNRPLLYRDPTGLQRCDPVVGALIGAGAGGVVGIIGGTLLGPAAGAAVGVLIGGGGGSVVGPEGTVVGGVGGGGLGAVAGAAIGPYVGGGIGAGIGAFIGHRICSGGDTPCDTYPRAVPQPTPSSDPMPPPPPPGGGDDKCVVAYEACLAWATQAATPSEARLRRRLCGQAYDRCKAGGVTVKFPDGSVVR